MPAPFAAAQAGANLGKSIIDIGTGLFGSGGQVSGSGTTDVTSEVKRTERLNLDQAAVEQIIADVLGGADGLASIFAGEQSAGIFNASASAQAAGDLASKLVGELAKLTAEKETTEAGTQKTKSSSFQATEEEGLLDSIGGFFGF